MPWCCTAREHLDDDHAAAAAWTKRLAGIGSSGWLALGVCNGKQLTGAGDVVGARGFGEQAVVADTMQAFWQHVNEEAADEPVGGERHLLVSIAALDAVILPLEGDALLVESNQSAVGDGDAVGVARQIGQHGLRSTEWLFGVDDPFDLAQRSQIGGECSAGSERGVSAEEAEAAGMVRRHELLQEQSPEQA